MDIKRIGSQPSGKGPAEYFTGTVRIDPLFIIQVQLSFWGACARSLAATQALLCRKVLLSHSL